MTRIGDSTVLLPVDVSGDATAPEGVFALLDPVNVVVLGYYPVPDQAAPAQIKYANEDDAAERLAAVADRLREDEGTVTEVLVFTHDRGETVDRVAEEYDCAAVVTTGTVDRVERVLVPLRGRGNLDGILAVVADLVADTGASVTLFHAVDGDGDGDSDGDEGERLLADAADRLAEAGLDAARIDRRRVETDDPAAAIREAAAGFDVVVIGESEPSLRDRILGATPTSVVDRTDAPTVVVRDRS